jgi:hypothetical protein
MTQRDLFDAELEPWQKGLVEILLHPLQQRAHVQDTIPLSAERIAAKEEEEVYLLQQSWESPFPGYGLSAPDPGERIVPDPLPLGAVWDLERRYPRTD